MSPAGRRPGQTNRTGQLSVFPARSPQANYAAAEPDNGQLLDRRRSTVGPLKPAGLLQMAFGGPRGSARSIGRLIAGSNAELAYLATIRNKIQSQSLNLGPAPTLRPVRIAVARSLIESIALVVETAKSISSDKPPVLCGRRDARARLGAKLIARRPVKWPVWPARARESSFRPMKAGQFNAIKLTLKRLALAKINLDWPELARKLKSRPRRGSPNRDSAKSGVESPTC